MRVLTYIVILVLSLTPWSLGYSAPAPKSFGALPRVYDAAISPDAKQVALFINVGGQYGVSIVDTDNVSGGNSRAVLLAKGIKPQWIKWANNDRVLISLWKSARVKSTPVTAGYIYTLDAKTMEGEILVLPKRISRQYNNTVVDFLEDDPNHILMSFSDVNVFAPDIKKVNVKTGKYKIAKSGRENIQYWHTDLRGEPRIGQGLFDKTTERWNLVIRDAEGKEWRNSDEFPGLDADADIYGFTSDPNELVIGAYQGKDTVGLYVYSLSAKKIVRKLFHNDDYDAGRPNSKCGREKYCWRKVCSRYN